ncbi:MAG TPA: ATP-binding cassette domain-containing protein, partial [Thiotrichales bacterium]|nr:ATP-binding cassette domain-containing protein [Thiotrichales bacterium]
MNVIHCRQLTKNYGKKTVLKAVELAVAEGAFFGLVGMNGCGKSTLIKCLLDLTAIDAGEIRLSGRSHREVAARAAVAYLPDRFSPPGHLKAGDFMRYMLRLHGSRVDGNKLADTLQALGMDAAVLDLAVNKLSKGMTQKLGLAV